MLNGLMQKRRDSTALAMESNATKLSLFDFIANAMELHLFCIKPSTCQVILNYIKTMGPYV